MTAADRLSEIRRRITRAERTTGRSAGATTLVAVSKTFPVEDIREVIAAGQRVFGENRVQEAAAKWPILRGETEGLELHLIGPLQSNKAAEAVALFDVIHTVDRDKIAGAIAAEAVKQGRRPRLFVQVNTGAEPQKAGIDPREAVAFVERCRSVHGLAIEGLMCIPPVEDAPGQSLKLAKLARDAGVSGLSMGMSADFEIAIGQGATHVRVGSALFGGRDYGAAA